MLHSKARTAAVGLGVVALVAAGVTPAQAGHRHDRISTVVDLSGPRGVESIRPGITLVTEDDGSFSLVVERRNRPARVIRLGGIDEAAGFASDASQSRGRFYFLTGGGGAAEELPPGAATLYKLRHGELQPFADIKGHQATDPDPDDQEGVPTDTNPYGVLALKDGTVLVADAGGNDLLRVWPDGTVKTVARFRPRMVEVPEGLPDVDMEGNPTGLPPAGTPINSEAVPTSVTVGPDGYWYVGELRGFPANPGTSQIWRIKPGSLDAVCDPEAPDTGTCTRYADGLTSIVDLTADSRSVYAVSLSKMSWLAMELGLPGSEVGGLFKVRRSGNHAEIAKDKLIMPGGADVARNGTIYAVGPVFGPGALVKIR
ncbi:MULTISPECIES: ScyD/ScyE family protein [unclassified Nocardioides]|uniref:ScyD/ScyE family protein n=1 Tax=unclassified Nocardioides TaxID=2615069 RepID=UPI000A947CF8|nr:MULTISPECIES: ScyD/ScyE family protein [unclassified Nocardioides]